MILGITLNKFAKLNKQGKNIKFAFWINYLLNKKSSYKFKTKDIQDLTFDQYTDLEIFLEAEDFKEFCTIFVLKKWYQIIYVHNLELIMLDYAAQKKSHYELNDFIFNPPIYGEEGSETIGYQVRKEFVERFGNNVVLMDVVCKGDLSKYKLVEQWKVSEFFFWANYLTGQRILEQVK